jgi:pilus assembly protein Flp/PilA
MVAHRAAKMLTGRIKLAASRMLTDARGATAIEYSLIAALISVAIIGGATVLGSSLTNEWLYVSNIVNPQLSH